MRDPQSSAFPEILSNGLRRARQIGCVASWKKSRLIFSIHNPKRGHYLAAFSGVLGPERCHLGGGCPAEWSVRAVDVAEQGEVSEHGR
jgi:hypothetical protein